MWNALPDCGEHQGLKKIVETQYFRLFMLTDYSFIALNEFWNASMFVTYFGGAL